MILEAVRQGLASTRFGARFVKTKPFKERPGVQPLAETVTRCRNTPKDSYPVIEGLEVSGPQLSVTDPETNKKYLVFKVYLCDGRRYKDRSHVYFGIGTVQQAHPSFLAHESEHCRHHPGEDQKPRRDINERDVAAVKDMMKRHDIFQETQNAGIFWGYDDDNLPMIQTYLFVNAETRVEANSKLRQFLDGLTARELNERGTRPLFIIKPAFEWTASKYGPVGVSRWPVSHSP